MAEGKTTYPAVRPLGRAPRPLGWLFSQERLEGAVTDHECSSCPDCVHGDGCYAGACCQTEGGGQ